MQARQGPDAVVLNEEMPAQEMPREEQERVCSRDSKQDAGQHSKEDGDFSWRFSVGRLRGVHIKLRAPLIAGNDRISLNITSHEMPGSS